MHKTVIAVITLILFSPLSWAAKQEVYVDVDEDGTPTFSDQGAPGSNTIEIDTPVTYDAPRTAPLKKPDQDDEPEKIEYTLEITDPPDDAAIRENTGALTLTVQISPGLAPGHSAELMMDGEKIRGLTSSGPVDLTNVDRGLHRFNVQVVDKNGRVVQEGPVNRVSMLRYHIRPNKS